MKQVGKEARAPWNGRSQAWVPKRDLSFHVGDRSSPGQGEEAASCSFVVDCATAFVPGLLQSIAKCSKRY